MCTTWTHFTIIMLNENNQTPLYAAQSYLDNILGKANEEKEKTHAWFPES